MWGKMITIRLVRRCTVSASKRRTFIPPATLTIFDTYSRIAFTTFIVRDWEIEDDQIHRMVRCWQTLSQAGSSFRGNLLEAASHDSGGYCNNTSVFGFSLFNQMYRFLHCLSGDRSASSAMNRNSAQDHREVNFHPFQKRMGHHPAAFSLLLLFLCLSPLSVSIELYYRGSLFFHLFCLP